MAVQAFISCCFPLDATVKNICNMLRPEIVPYVSTDVKLGSLPNILREKIARADCLIAILTEKGSTAFIQNEVGIAFGLDKPIFAIYEESVNVQGIQPYLSTYIKYQKGDEASIAKQLVSLKSEVIEQITSREIEGSPKELLENLRKNGIIGIYPDRAAAFRVFSPIWIREHDIRIVGSSIEGFKRGIGIDARELISSKLNDDPQSTIYILLTHSSFASYREKQERELGGYIVKQIETTMSMLEEIRDSTQAKDRLRWKFFKGAPTCFMIKAGNFMLLNPYLYMQPAYFNFSMIVTDTSTVFDIYSHYDKYHFNSAWMDKDLSVDKADDR